MQQNNVNCTICDSPTHFEAKYDAWEVLRCDTCSHAFSSNISKPVEIIYDQSYFQKNWFIFPNLKIFNLIEKTIRETFGHKAKIYDLGCGNGNLLRYLHSKGYYNLHGCDIVSCLLPGVEDQIKFTLTDMLDINANNAFDVAISIANIEHLEDINGYMIKLREILVSDGIAIIYTINENSLIYTISQIMRKIGINFAAKQLYDPHHINHFNKKSLSKLAQKHDFEILLIKTFNYPLKSTDVFVENRIIRSLVLTGILLVNIISSLLKSEISQLLVIKPKH
jgi:2-polyprenyl-3-methyl-5-hydroxy-6-metoxy-1,4-benzoquinol methylase